MIDLKGKNALITGSSRGVGQQVAIGLAKLGCNVIVHGRTKESTSTTLELLKEYNVNTYRVFGELSEEAQVKRLEKEIDTMNANLEALRSFILPGGSALAAHLHVCRTVSRRAERLCVELATMEAINTFAVTYLNRVSDWFFVAARVANNDGKDDVLWVPGANR